jgi:hypothetical protein
MGWGENGYFEDAPTPAPAVDAGAVVTQMYEAILGRAPDASGYQAFVDAINNGADVGSLAQSMASSQEAQNNASSGKGPSQEQVQNVVQQASSDPGAFMQQATQSKTPTLAKFGIDVNSLDQNKFFQDGGVFLVTQKDGSVLHADGSGNIIGYEAPLSTYGNDPSLISKGYRNIPYANTSMINQMDANGMVTVNGLKVPLIGKEVALNSKGKPLVDSSGQTVAIQALSPKPTESGLTSFAYAAMPAIMLSIATGGTGMAAGLGGMVLGSSTAAGAATLGSAMLGATTSALMAGISGGDVGKAALIGAIGGAIGANSVDIANGLVGEDTIKTIAAATRQTQAQISNLITNSISTGVSAAAAGKGDIATLIANNLASTAVGNYTGNIMRSLDSDLMNKVAGSVSTVARIGTTAALNNKDPQQAINNSVGQIIGNLVSQNLIQPGVTAVKDAIKNDNTLTPTEKTDAQKNAQLVDDGFKQIVQQFAQSTGTNITPEEIDQYIATAGAKDLPQYYNTAANVTVQQAPKEYTDVGLTNPLVKKDITTSALTPEEIAQQDAEIAAADKAAAADAAINPNQTQLDKLWQDYMTGLKGAKGTSPTYSLDGLSGTSFLGTPEVATNGPGEGEILKTPIPLVKPSDTSNSAAATGVPIAPAPVPTKPTPTGATPAIAPGITTTGKTGAVSGTGGGATPIISTIPSLTTVNPIRDLTPGLVKGSSFQFANQPTFTEQVNQVPTNQPFDYSKEILNAATGGSTTADYIPIQDLTPGLTKGSQFGFAHKPSFVEALNQIANPVPTDYTQQILNAAQGGLIGSYAEGGDIVDNPLPTLQARQMHGRAFQPMGHFEGARFAGYQPKQYATGGDVEEHNPEFFSVGGLESMENTYVKGDGDGTSDSVPAMLANGEFVIPADVVSKLGNGSNDAGAHVLDGFLVSIREHAQNHDPKKLPPQSKGPLAYLLDAKRKVG